MIDHLAHLRADCDAILDVVQRGALARPVAACPGWTVQQLVEHVGSVHRWATAIVRSGEAQPENALSVDDLLPWFAAGAEALIATLTGADRAGPCWSFTTDKTKGFWVRRQALETGVHRWDAERAAGEPGLIDPVLAGDGVAEVVDLMTPRQVKLGRLPALTVGVELRASDSGESWVLGDGPVSGTVTAPAEVLLLLLWHRVDPGDPRVRVEGDAAYDVVRLALAP